MRRHDPLNPIITIPGFDLANAGLEDTDADDEMIPPRRIDYRDAFVEAYGTMAATSNGNINSVSAPSKSAASSSTTSSNSIAPKIDSVYENTNAFELRNALEPAECRYIIKTAEPLMASLDALYAESTRSADRAMIRSPTVAQQLYDIILPYLEKRDYADRTPLCFGQDGVWLPLGLNECLKVFRYTDNGHFAAMGRGFPTVTSALCTLSSCT